MSPKPFAFEHLSNAIAMVGASCRVPGASSLDEFWRLLVEEKNVIRKAPVGRWSVERFLREGEPKPGFTYSFAGGYLDDPFDFDPIPFGLSSREAAQTDPQQRLLLELVWQAFEDAGVSPEKLKDKRVGVYVGASNVDYQGAAALDASIIESHFMTGNSLSILANRISYVFDFHGPSITVDTACSSSLAALQHATVALETGEIDFAVVAGVNLLLSPIPFIGFAQARMMSPTGLSRPFSADADGYVRSEGGVAILLTRGEAVAALDLRVRSYILGCALNSDGRTSGIALPSSEGQSKLIASLYRSLDLDPEKLAFVEAHGTGTQAGDPVEAMAIGEALGRKRRNPLLIGSAKSNVGHLESASGLVSLLKTSLALQNGILPRSLFSENLNSAIDFERLNLRVAQSASPVDLTCGAVFAGVCNYGFGGTNAHAVLCSPSPREAALVRRVSGVEIAPSEQTHPKIMLLSAATPEALKARALQVCAQIEHGSAASQLAEAYIHQQTLMPHRVATVLDDDLEVTARLRHFAESSSAAPGLSLGSQRGGQARMAFVFSGNGSQYPEMGKAAYAANPVFKSEVDIIDALFKPKAGWSIAEALECGLDSERFRQTSVIQPVIFAIQSALVATMAFYGVRPSMVLGHSIGEVAAAEACGALTRAQALEIIFHRSNLQEVVRGEGAMLVAALDKLSVIAELEASGAELEIAALNSPTSTTVVGPHEHIRAFARHCRGRRIAAIELDLDYPFHSMAMDPLQGSMLEKLAGIKAVESDVDFVSTVTGDLTSGVALDAEYWWRNVRSPVCFKDAVVRALEMGANMFVEIGPHPILLGPVADIFSAGPTSARAFETLTKSDDLVSDPVARILAQLVANGAGFDPTVLVGPKPAHIVALPGYPFQRERQLLTASAESLTVFGRVFESRSRHPLLGARMAEGSPEWRNLLDPVLLPYLDDHRVNGAVVVPASGLIEMALAAGRDLYGEVALALQDFDILNALVVGAEDMREVSTRFAEATGTIEIWSRRRFAQDKWLINARGQISVVNGSRPAALAPPVKEELQEDSPVAVYEEARRAGLEYGPCFQLVTQCQRDRFTAQVWLDQSLGGLGAFSDIHVLHPVSVDAAFHGLFVSRPQRDGETKAHLPVRFHRVQVFEQGAKIHQAITLLTHETERYKTVSISFLDANGVVVASVEGAVLRAVWFARATIHDRTFRRTALALATPNASPLGLIRKVSDAPFDSGDISRAWLLTRAFCVSLAHRLLGEAVLASGSRSLTQLREDALIASSAQPYFDCLVDLLAERNLLEEKDGELLLCGQLDLPTPETLLSTLMQRYPEANFEIHAASIAACAAPALLRTGVFVAPPVSLKRRFESASCILAPLISALAEKLRRLSSHYGRTLRILALEPESAGLARVLAPLVESGQVELTLAVADKNRKDLAGSGSAVASMSIVELETIQEAVGATAGFDALVGVALFGPLGKSNAMLSRAFELLAPAAPVLIANPNPEASLDVLLGVWKDWLVDSSSGLAAASVTTSDRVIKALKRCGVREIEAQLVGGGLGSIVTGMRVAPDSAMAALAETEEFVVAADGFMDPVFAFDGAAMLEPSSAASHLAQWMEVASGDAPVSIYILPTMVSHQPFEEVAQRIETIKEILSLTVGWSRRVAVNLVMRSPDGHGSRPEDAALQGFVRVAINEYPTIDLRMIAVASDLATIDLRQVIADARGEREIFVDATGVKVQRVLRGMTAGTPLGETERSRLHFRQSGRVESFEWLIEQRLAPKAGEIEIEVAATGLNFRDVLVGLGVIDDEILQAGLTNASLGFECSGTVLRIGEGVLGLAPGDRVMGFASGALASHLVAPAWQFIPIPNHMNLEAAATIPVAFATAWYSLMERAHLRDGDDVLIHGAAGGVGLAAIQIAKRAGARVIGTASSDARRAIAVAQGADLVFDSRGQRFVEAVRSSLGGVDVVLNSLDGAAMLASFHLLKPFGRFIELGKKDFLDNTHLGLRPFVRNIMYAGVDLDELLSFDRKSAQRVMRSLVELFESGDLQPLPHQVYEAHEIGSAFRAMQSSEHIGKIVIRPARYGAPEITAPDYKARDGVYLIVGGASGLGFATAQWLARSGASTLVLASRRGEIDPSLQSELEQLRRAGAKVLVEALDVRDKEAVVSLTKRLVREHGPLRGVVHAAVQLDDGLIASLQGDRLRAVLETKIQGALNLESATDGLELDFFVLYSSATTVIGSPGQGAYVAANAFLEGFAQRRRALGKPALAIGWGAIADVGLIARDRKLGERLQRSTGVIGVKASEALAQLGRLLAMGDKVEPLQFYTMIAPGPAAAKLALLKSPAYLSLGLWRSTGEAEELGSLESALAGKNRSQAHAMMVKALSREAAQILRMTEDQIDPHRALGESGFDSLMLLELVISVERLTGLQLRMVGAGERTLSLFAMDIVNEMLGKASDPQLDGDAPPGGFDEPVMPDAGLMQVRSAPSSLSRPVPAEPANG